MNDTGKTDNQMRFFTTTELADILKMNVQVIARKLQQGEIPGYKIGKDWRVYEKDLWSWLEKHSNQKKITPREKILNSFIKQGRIKILPAQRKKRKYVLEHILKQFEIDRVYTEKEVNNIISEFHEDYCTVRREFIMEKMMSRSGGKYHRNGTYAFLK